MSASASRKRATPGSSSGRPPAVARTKGPHSTGTTRTSGAEEVLEEHDLELDRVLDGVAVVLDHHRVAAGGDQAVDERPRPCGSAPNGVA